LPLAVPLSRFTPRGRHGSACYVRGSITSMKTRYILLAVFASTTTLFASLVDWYDNAKPPGISLPTAYALADTALDSATNQFHCVRATITTEFSGGAEWYFTFCTTNLPPTYKYVGVRFDGKVHVDDELYGGVLR